MAKSKKATSLDWTNDRATVELDGCTVTLRIKPDDDVDTSYLEQEEFADALEQYRAGQFCHVGIVAYAERKGVTLGHASLWGIEHWGDRASLDYIDETALELAQEAVEAARAKLAELRS